MNMDPEDKGNSSIRILFIEDDRDYFLTVNALLSGINRAKYVIRWVPDYLSALDELHSGRHDFCLLNYRFGDFDGPSILEYADERGLTTPIIVMACREEADTPWLGTVDRICRDEICAEALEQSILSAVYRARSEKRMARHVAAMDAAMDGLAIIDKSGYVVSANKSMAAMYLFDEPALLEGVDLSAFFAGEYSRKLARSALAKAGRSGRWSGDGQGVRLNGETFPKEFAISPVGDGQFALVERDISESQDLKEQLFRTQRVEGIGQMTGGIIHDFNNLLSAVLGYSQFGLLKLNEGHPLRAYFEEIEKAAERATLLTQQVRSLTSGEVGQAVAFCVNDAVAGLEMMLSRVISENVDMATELAEDLGYVSMDRGQLEQVILNLAINAADAMPAGGRLTPKACNVSVPESGTGRCLNIEPGDYVRLTVSDTGEGMSQQVMTRIFEPFFTTKDSDKGTGLGLSICHGIVTCSGGTITVESVPGDGAAFNILLPRLNPPDVDVSASSRGDGKRTMPSGIGTILLAEDEPSVRAVTSQTLRNQGYHVIETCNGREALDAARAMKGQEIALLVTDVVMPVLGGRELGRKFEMLHPDAKILYVSGYTDGRAILPSGEESQGQDTAFVRKPYSPVDLARKVSELLTGRRYGVGA